MTDPMFHDLSGAPSITPLGQIMWKDPALRTEADIRQIYNQVGPPPLRRLRAPTETLRCRPLAPRAL